MKRKSKNNNVRTPNYIIAVSAIALLLGYLALFGDLDPSIMITITIIGIIAIFILMSIHDSRKYMEPENEGYPEIIETPKVVTTPVIEVAPPLPPPVVEPTPVIPPEFIEQKTEIEMAIEKKKDRFSGNLQDRPPVQPPPTPKTHVETHTYPPIYPPVEKFAPVPNKIPATSRQLYGDIYSFCDQLPLKNRKDIEAKLKPWGRRYAIVNLQPEGMYILVDGAGSHYSLRIPQFGYFKTAAE